MVLTNNIHQRERMFLKIMAGVGGQREGGKEEGERGEWVGKSRDWD